MSHFIRRYIPLRFLNDNKDHSGGEVNQGPKAFALENVFIAMVVIVLGNVMAVIAFGIEKSLRRDQCHQQGNLLY